MLNVIQLVTTTLQYNLFAQENMRVLFGCVTCMKTHSKAMSPCYFIIFLPLHVLCFYYSVCKEDGLHITVFYLPGLQVMWGRDSSVSIVTHCRLDGPGVESWWGRDLPHL